MGFCLLSHLQVSRHTRVSVYLKGRGKGFRSPPRLMPGVYNVLRCTIYYEITLMPATLSSHWTTHPRAEAPDWLDQGRDSEGFTLKSFQVFGNPSSQSRQSSRALQNSLRIANEISTILFTKLCLISAHGPGTLTPL